MYELRITGFKTKAQVMAFASWYEGQGEQDADIWFECRKEDGEIDIDSMHVDNGFNQVWTENSFEMKLKI